MRNAKVKTGHLGESVAKNYFIQNGFEVYTADYHNQNADLIVMNHTTGRTKPVDVKVFKVKLSKDNDLIVTGGGKQDRVMLENQAKGIKNFICVEIGGVIMPLAWRRYSKAKGKWCLKYVDGAKQTVIDKLSVITLEPVVSNDNQAIVEGIARQVEHKVMHKLVVTNRSRLQ